MHSDLVPKLPLGTPAANSHLAQAPSKRGFKDWFPNRSLGTREPIGVSFVLFLGLIPFEGVPMKMVVAPAAAVLLAGLAQVVLAEPPGKERGKELAALEQKMLGAWKGRVGCDGRLVFRADGTYELTEYGPAPIR